MSLVFHTAAISYAGPDRVDITRKSGSPLGLCFAPSDALLWPYIAKRKAGGLTEEDWREYRRRFLDEMRESYARNRGAWADLLGGNHAVLCCYCPAYPCHRYVVAWILLQLGAVYLGELDKDGTKPEHVAVVGSRPPPADAPQEHKTEWFHLTPLVWRAVRGLPAGAVLVSGAAPGVDSIAEHATGPGVPDGQELRRIILPAPWDAPGYRGPQKNSAGPARNAWVARIADRAVAFPSSWGRGTQDLIDKMQRAGKPVEVLKP